MYAESSQIYLPFTTPDICVPIPTSLPRTHITYLRSPRYCALYPALYPGLYRLSADRYLDRWGLEHHVIAFVCRVDMIPLQIELKVFASISSFLGYDVSNVWWSSNRSTHLSSIEYIHMRLIQSTKWDSVPSLPNNRLNRVTSKTLLHPHYEIQDTRARKSACNFTADITAGWSMGSSPFGYLHRITKDRVLGERENRESCREENNIWILTVP